MTTFKTPPNDAPDEEWGALAVSIPGWRWMPGMNVNGMVVLDADESGIEVVRKGIVQGWGYADSYPDPDDPATAGCLLALLGVEAWRIQYTHGYNGVFYTPSEPSRDRWSEPTWIQVATLGRACIAAAHALGRWPGGER